MPFRTTKKPNLRRHPNWVDLLIDLWSLIHWGGSHCSWLQYMIYLKSLDLLQCNIYSHSQTLSFVPWFYTTIFLHLTTSAWHFVGFIFLIFSFSFFFFYVAVLQYLNECSTKIFKGKFWTGIREWISLAHNVFMAK